MSRLLDLSRLESGAIALEHRSFAISPVVTQVIAEQPTPTTPVTVQSTVSPELMVMGDPERIHQVIANLVENAIRHAEQHVTIHAHIDRAGEHHPEVIIEVIDDGPGIPSSDIDYVFERFARTDTGRARTQGGAGLGLAIAKWIVDLHGGSIAAKSISPHGCRMVVRLPHDTSTQTIPTERITS